ncbi:aldo/keto reductase [Anabaena azotica]|uniref:aldo/keto reductase n=1 Tax=Anabaena azotica TaxID=197653 RepID=UPI0036F22BD0
MKQESSLRDANANVSLERGVSTWSPFGGRRRHQNLQDIPAIAQLAQAKGVSVYAIVLAWLRAKSSAILPIPGASKISSIEDSVSALNVKLSDEEVQKI